MSTVQSGTARTTGTEVVGDDAVCMVFLQSLVGVRTTEEVEVAVTPMLSSQAQMPAYDLIVYNGRVVTTSSVSRTDVWIGVIGGKIATVSSSPCPLEAAARSIDADGAYITPGGVDTHVHLSQLQHPAGTDTGDTFESGTRSAIAGGTTTIVAFANQQKHDESLYPIVEEYHRRSAGQCYTDYGFHLILTNPTPKVLDEEIPELFEEQGISSIKVYMTYENRKVTDRDMLEIMIRARKLGITLMIHAENDDMVNLVIDHLKERSLTAPAYHAVARHPLAEAEATYRAISLGALMATPILLVHVSSAVAMSTIRSAQTEGQPVFAETCPQYLLLLAENMRPKPHAGGCGCGSSVPLRPDNYISEEEDGYEGAKLICSPPLRESKSDLDAVWKGVRNGTVTTISSDHAPGRYDHPMGKKKGKVGGLDFTKTPNGLPGLETRLPLMMTYGVGQQKISIQRWVEICCTQPARLYGLHERKGSIAPGLDADLVIWYPEHNFPKTRISNSMLHHDIDYTPYEGVTVTNWPRFTILRGEIAWDRDNGGVIASKGSGEYVKRTRSDLTSGVEQAEPFLETIVEVET